jgi:ATP-dependent Lon protease
MTFFCKYIFKKGSKKGQFCNEPLLNNISFCVKHQNTVSHEPNLDDTLKQKILNLPTTIENKSIILKHYYNMKRSDVNSTEYYKNQIFVDLCISYPWDKKFDINYLLSSTDIKSFINYIKQSFDKHIYGMENVKNDIINIICKFITNPNSTRNNIALYGQAGIGKSKFFKILSEILGIPIKTISLGGIKDSSFFLGHGYVYVESGPGKILQNIIDSKISNPIVYFDELDKVSETDNGKDIYSFLCYLTDPTQNTEFTDHYFYGMKFDLSKVFYVFTFNDIDKIDKILLDRLNVVYVEPPSNHHISIILSEYCIPEIIQNIKITKKITFNNNFIELIIKTFEKNIDKTVSSGIREFYRIIEKIFLQINKEILLGFYDDVYEIFLNDTLINYYINVINIKLPEDNTSHLHMYI